MITAHSQTLRPALPRAGLGRQSRRRHRARPDRCFSGDRAGPGHSDAATGAEGRRGSSPSKSIATSSPRSRRSCLPTRRLWPATCSTSTSTAALPSLRDAPVRIAGNLPYNISSPILFRLLELSRTRPVRDATLMLQREVADRIVAQPGTAEYGVLSVLRAMARGCHAAAGDPARGISAAAGRAFGARSASPSGPRRSELKDPIFSSGWCAACLRSAERRSPTRWRLCRRHRRRSGPRARRCRHRPPPAAGDAGDH